MMEFSKAAQEVLIKAQMMQLSCEHAELCVEHVLYGLIEFSRSKQEYDDPEMIQECNRTGRKLARELAGVVRAKKALEAQAAKGDGGFVPATVLLGRAMELAQADGVSKVHVEHLTAAVLQSGTLMVDFLKKKPTDAKDASRPEPADRLDDATILDDTAHFEIVTRLDESITHLDSIEDKASSSPPKETPQPEVRPKPETPVSPSREPEKEKPNGFLSTTQAKMVLALAVLAKLAEEEPRETTARDPRKPKVRRRTKIGPFTYHGGSAAAFFQYFLFGALVPGIPLLLLERFTHVVTVPPSPLVAFLVNAFIVATAFYLMKGVAILVGVGNKAFGAFLTFMLYCVLYYTVGMTICTAWSWPEFPTWMRVMISVLWLLTLIIGTALYDHLNNQGTVSHTSIHFQNVHGTPGQIFFRILTRNLILPTLIFAFFWVSRRIPEGWQVKALWILGFLEGWSILHTAWVCLQLRFQGGRRRGLGLYLTTFLATFHLSLTIPALVAFLHWLFGWLPMKIWVIVLLALWALGSLVMGVGAAIAAKEE